MEQISRLLPSLSRFKDKPSDIVEDEKSHEAETGQHENQDKQTEETRLNPKPEEHKGFVNMAYSQTNGDDQEEKDMGSIFKSFNNFTSRFKFTPDKIEDTKPPEANYGTFDNSPKSPDDSPKKTDEATTYSNEANDVTGVPDKDQNTQRTIDKPANGISEKRGGSRSLPEVPTIVTGSQPNSPQKTSAKDETDGQTSSRQGVRRSTDNILFFEGATLSPDLDLRRRHSTDIIHVPQPLNEELVLEDLKKRGSPFQRRSTKKRQIPDHSRRESYSPRMERKEKNSLTNGPTETRRKTLAELALESGYKPKSDVVDGPDKDLKVATDHDKVISASGRKSPSPIRITGELYLTLEYCMETKAFIVQVHTANNIAVVDHKKQSSNPYVKTYLLPDKKSKRKTKTVRDNLNPQFDDVIKYPISYDELLTRTLSLTVWHDDHLGRNDFLGEVVIPLGKYVDQGNSLEKSIAKWYQLEEKVDHESDNQPEIILAVKYVSGDKVRRKPGSKKSLPSRGEMQLQILEAKNLPGKDADGMSDPFCKILLHPDKKGKTKHQTKKIDRTLNPVWNYKLSFEDLSIEDLYDRVLDITVWDHDIMSRDEFLGGVRLGTGEGRNEWDDSNDAEAQIWHTMLNRTNVWIQVVVPLRPNMDIRKAT